MVELSPTILCGDSNVVERNSWARDISGRRKSVSEHDSLLVTRASKSMCPAAVCTSNKILLSTMGGVGMGGETEAAGGIPGSAG